MKLLKPGILLLALLPGLKANCQQTDLFLTLQTGSPFRTFGNNGGEAPFLLNINLGAEQYIMDKLSIALSFRKAFYMLGKASSENYKTVYNNNDYTYSYTEDYDSYAIDFESKFFFDGPTDDGLYMSSCLSFQHLTMNINILSVEQLYSSNPAAPVVHTGEFSDDMNIYPFTLKIGHRTSGDVLVLDYFLGLCYNMGAKGISRIHEQTLDYYDFHTLSIPIGVKLGVKF